MEVYELEPSEPRKGISRHLTVEGALPICEQCNSGGQRGPVQISVDVDGSAGFRVTMVWVHKPFGEPDCRDVYICDECFWAIQQEAYGGIEPWFVGWMAYAIDPECRQCQEVAQRPRRPRHHMKGRPFPGQLRHPFQHLRLSGISASSCPQPPLPSLEETRENPID